MNWIECSEQMPNKRQEVIVFDVERNKVQSGMQFQGKNEFDEFVFVDFNSLYYEVINPSYWMPLPDKPTGV